MSRAAGAAGGPLNNDGPAVPGWSVPGAGVDGANAARLVGGDGFLVLLLPLGFAPLFDLGLAEVKRVSKLQKLRAGEA